MVEHIAIYGAGGLGRDVAWLVETCFKETGQCQVACFIEDDPDMQGSIINELPVMSLPKALETFPNVKIVGAIGDPSARQQAMEKAAKTGASFVTLIHPRVELSRWIQIGNGSVICAGSLFGVNVVLGKHVQINLGCTIGHDTRLGNFATLAPGAHISGYVYLGERAFIGAGAVIINGTKQAPIIIEDDVVIGAGACVTKSVEAGLTVAGVPAKPISSRGN